MSSTATLRTGYEGVRIPNLWIAVALSLLLHALGLIAWIPNTHLPFDDADKTKGGLAIRLRSPPTPDAAPPPAPAPAPPRKAPVRRAEPAPPPAKTETLGRIAPLPSQLRSTPPPVIATERPSTTIVAPPAPAQNSAPAPGQDLASYIAARRRARDVASAPAAPAQSAETEQQRHNRTVAENLGLTRAPSFGNDPNRGGGIFQIRSMAYDTAEFSFFGWNKAIGRNSTQVIEVRRGNSPNMEVAVARKMISIIRELSDGDFEWQSQRTGKTVWLSARPADSAALEAFILRELFPEFRAR